MKLDTLQSILIAFIMLNFLMLYACADYTSYEYSPPNLSDKIWYVVEGGIYPLMSICFIKFNTRKDFRLVWKILALFFLIRWIWEIIAFSFNMDVNKPFAVMAILYTIAFAAILFITFLPYLKCRESP